MFSFHLFIGITFQSNDQLKTRRMIKIIGFKHLIKVFLLKCFLPYQIMYKKYVGIHAVTFITA